MHSVGLLEPHGGDKRVGKTRWLPPIDCSSKNCSNLNLRVVEIGKIVVCSGKGILKIKISSYPFLILKLSVIPFPSGFVPQVQWAT